jgi:hypothetical protein
LIYNYKMINNNCEKSSYEDFIKDDDMKQKLTPSRLELHRMKFHHLEGKCELLSIYELDEYEKDLLQQELLKNVKVKRLTFTNDEDEEIYDKAFFDVCSEWGVMCVHPTYRVKKLENTVGWHCDLCGCSILWP